jgi:alkylated DNA repair dioxygenase AlkB
MSEKLPPGFQYFPGFLPLSDSQRLFEQLKHEVKWSSRRIRLFGKEVPEPRLTAWYGEPGAAYTYSGLRLEPEPWVPSLLELRARAEKQCACRFNSVLLNLYRNGQDSMGWHRDNEPELGARPTIASLSLGAERDFRIRPYRGAAHEAITLKLENGSLLLMEGESQERFEHSLPKRARVADARINLTWRWVGARNGSERRKIGG